MTSIGACRQAVALGIAVLLFNACGSPPSDSAGIAEPSPSAAAAPEASATTPSEATQVGPGSQYEQILGPPTPVWRARYPATDPENSTALRGDVRVIEGCGTVLREDGPEGRRLPILWPAGTSVLTDLTVMTPGDPPLRRGTGVEVIGELVATAELSTPDGHALYDPRCGSDAVRWVDGSARVIARSEPPPSVEPSSMLDPPPPPPTQPPPPGLTGEDALAELHAAQDRWRSLQLTDYAIEYIEGCFCFNSDVVFTITVEGGAVVDVAADGPHDDRGVPRTTVEDVFARLERSIAQDGAYVDGSYDSQTGLPVDIRVDVPGSIDEEYRLRLRLLS